MKKLRALKMNATIYIPLHSNETKDQAILRLIESIEDVGVKFNMGSDIGMTSYYVSDELYNRLKTNMKRAEHCRQKEDKDE